MSGLECVALFCPVQTHRTGYIPENAERKISIWSYKKLYDISCLVTPAREQEPTCRPSLEPPAAALPTCASRTPLTKHQAARAVTSATAPGFAGWWRWGVAWRPGALEWDLEPETLSLPREQDVVERVPAAVLR